MKRLPPIGTASARRGRPHHYSRCRGAALISTLLAMTFLLLIGALASGQARLSFLIQNRTHESVEALIAAETGLATALADFAREPRFDRLEGADESPYPFVTAPPDGPLPASFDVDLSIEHRSQQLVDIVAVSQGRNRARRRLLATVERSSRPYVPSALYSANASPSTSGSSTLRIAGLEREGVPALAFPSLEAASAIHQQLASQGATITGSPAASAAAWSGIEATIDRLRTDANVSTLPTDVAGPVSQGIWLSSASVAVASADGSGIWLIDGDLQVQDALDFEGLLFVLGDVIFADTSAVAIDGALIQAGPGQALQLRGNTSITFDSAALDLVDSLKPELLDRRGTLIGWRDDG